MDVGGVIVGVTGIVVSGVLGPAATSWLAHRHDTEQFVRQSEHHKRDELRNVLDDAAVLLAEGPRILRERSVSEEKKRHAAEWSNRIYPMRERLVLRLPETHPVVQAYDAVRITLQAVAQHADDDRAVSSFEQARDSFLSAARDALNAPIAERAG